MKLFQSVKIVFTVVILLSSYQQTALAKSENPVLLNYHYLGEFNIEQAKTAVAKLPPLSDLPMNYKLALYDIHYTTPDPAGNMTTASGMVAMPVNPQQPVAIVSYQHGTRFNKEDVPSRPMTRDAAMYATFGSHGGYMVVLPDYLGLGDNTLPLHPYVLADTLATSSINMLLAAKELAATLHYPVNNTLYLAGYSEGGFTTNVMYERMLKDHPEIKVTAVAPGSAPYDWKVTLTFLMDHPGPRATAYLALFMYSAETYTHFWKDLSAIFVKPYDTLIPSLFDGTHQTQEILDALPKNPYDICQPGFMQHILDGTDPHSAELIANFNHYNYQPTAPLLLVGTKGDQDVPFAGAEMAYAVFKQKSNDVRIKSVSDVLDHIQAYPLVTLEQLKFFKQYDH